MAEQYVVTGHCASFDTVTTDGPMRVMFYRGQPVPADAPAAQVKHHLSVNLIAVVPGTATVGVDATGAAVVGSERAGEVPGDPGEQFLSANAVTDEQAAQRLPVSKTAPAASEDTAKVVEEKRAAARSKLPADGSMPKSSNGQDVWVEYHVAQGGNYDDLVKQDKQELIKLAQSRQS